MSRRRLPMPKLLTIALLAMLPAMAAHADPQSQDRGRGHSQRDDSRDDRGDRGDLRDRSDLRPAPRGSLSDAVRRVERDTRGEVLSAERIQYDGRDMHRVKVVDDQGRVRVFMQDPQRRDSNRGRPQPPPRDEDDN